MNCRRCTYLGAYSKEDIQESINSLPYKKTGKDDFHKFFSKGDGFI